MDFDRDFFSSGLGIALIMFIFVLSVGVIILFVFYLITLQNTLKAVSPENRKMPPANVWLLFIPLFNIIWQFMVVDAIASSLKLEYEKHGVFSEDRPTYSLGLAMAILQCCAIIPFLWGLASLGGLVCWIVYWVQVNSRKNEIINIQRNATLPESEKSIFL